MAKRKNNRHPFARFLFLAYCGLMFWLLFCRTKGWINGLSYGQMLRQNINLVPLLTIQNYLYVILNRTNDALLLHCIINLAGNVLMFIPIGYLLPKIWPIQRKFFLFVATCAGSIFLVETLQLFTLLGSFDIDDIILNLSGMTIGYLFAILKK